MQIRPANSGYVAYAAALSCNALLRDTRKCGRSATRRFGCDAKFSYAGDTAHVDAAMLVNRASQIHCCALSSRLPIDMSDPLPDSPLPDTSAPRVRRPGLRGWLALIVLIVAALGWMGYRYSTDLPDDGATQNQLSLDVIGGWWNVTGDRYLALDWEGRQATLWDYSNDESGIESRGSWRTTGDNRIWIKVSGAAGSLEQEFELVGNDAELFLAPTPSDHAKLLDSWIADHGDSDDDEPPAGPPGEST